MPWVGARTARRVATRTGFRHRSVPRAECYRRSGRGTVATLAAMQRPTGASWLAQSTGFRMKTPLEAGRSDDRSEAHRLRALLRMPRGGNPAVERDDGRPNAPPAGP